MFSFPKIGLAAAFALCLFSVPAQAQAGEGYGIGRTATPKEIKGWDIDVRPDGHGFPPGQGTAAEGEPIFLEKCAACHGEFGEGVGRFPVLIGGKGTLKSTHPVKTIGSYWPFASTLFDYIKRSMPFGNAQSLSDDEVYSLVAYLLYSNDIIEENTVMNGEAVTRIKMPNADGFIPEDPRPDVHNKACMKDCKSAIEIKSYARKVNVTPDYENKPKGRRE